MCVFFICLSCDVFFWVICVLVEDSEFALNLNLWRISYVLCLWN